MNFQTILLIAVGVIFMMMLMCKSKGCGCSKSQENYCCGAQAINPYMIPEFPTLDHYFTNNYVRYDMASDEDPFNPYYTYPGVQTYY